MLIPQQTIALVFLCHKVILQNNDQEMFQIYIFHNESFNLYALIIVVLNKMYIIYFQSCIFSLILY